MIKVGLVGFGLSGRVFHAPFIEANPDFELVKVVERNKNNSQKIYPHIKVVKDISNLLNDKDIELIVITTPNTLHFEMAKKSLLAGKHIVIEKPFTPAFLEANQLIDLAKERNLKLFVYQNRRWDNDFRTIRNLVKKNTFGEIYEYEAHFNRYAPNYKKDAWRDKELPGSGILFDLGSHLIDQAITLFGFPQEIDADIQKQRKESKVDDYFKLVFHYDKLKIILTAGMLVKNIGPRFIVKGTNAEFTKFGIDPQEEALKNGDIPIGKNWGKESKDYYGFLKTFKDGNESVKRVETLAGCYQDFYKNVFEVLKKGKEMVVKPEDAARVIKIIEIAFEINQRNNQ